MSNLDRIRELKVENEKIKQKLSANKAGQTTATKPNYYLMPNGVQVGEITDHLTSNGGQSVQYVARSTRLDGQHKGERVQDLTKACILNIREIRRISDTEVTDEELIKNIFGM